VRAALRAAAAAVALLAAQAAAATPLPPERPGSRQAVAVRQPVQTPQAAVVLPPQRPVADAPRAEPAQRTAVLLAPRPGVRPSSARTARTGNATPALAETRIEALGATAAAFSPPPAAYAGSGPICGDRRLSGARLPQIGGSSGCGIVNPVRVSAVAGVRLDPPATVNCDTARALADWVETTAAPSAARHAGAPLVKMSIAASYACRRVNNRPSGALSEHATGNAIDISAFILSDGRRVTLLDDWRGAGRSFLLASWRGACNRFGTVLGPDSDRYHRDHFHFDVARHRNGAFCQ
jgi:hypothetical protein